jgi:hypothetical protein
VGEERCANMFLAGETEAKRPLGRSTHRGEDNIKMNLREIGPNIL